MAARRRTTQRDVAAAAHVSTATVSYVLSGRAGRVRPVSDETRDRVLAAVERTGYRINHSARSLRRQRTDVACVVYATPANPWTEEVINVFGPAAAKHGLTTLCLPIVDGAVSEAVSFLSRGSADAALLLPGHTLTPGQLRTLAGSGLAIVAFDDRAEPRGFDVVRTHQRAAREALIDRLADSGRRRLAFFVHSADEVADRTSGYHGAVVRNGLRFDPDLVFPVATDRGAAHQTALRLLSRRRRPDAIVSASDRAAVQAIYAAQELRLRVPDDVAIVGSGDIDEGRAARPALTTIGLPADGLSEMMDRLLRRLRTPRRIPGRALDLPWQVVARSSG